MSTSRIDLLLSAARARLDRVTPEEALLEVGEGAVVVDIRPAASEPSTATCPAPSSSSATCSSGGSTPTSSAALPIADDDLRVVVLCQEGYTSSLAAAALRDVGVHRATDVVGGYAAWVAAGVEPPAALHVSGG